MKKETVTHNTISRMTNRVIEGGLYMQPETFYEQGYCIDLYYRVKEEELDRSYSIFNYIAQSGFGKDKSTGKGHFIIKDVSLCTLPEAENPTHIMSLSSMIPGSQDSTDARYDIFTKFGKLGGDYAKAGFGGVDALRPFKKPLIMMKPGCTFAIHNGTAPRYLGTMMQNVHEDTSIVHYAYGFPLKISLKGGNDGAN